MNIIWFLIVTILIVYGCKYGTKKNKQHSMFFANTITTVGVLGTFMGIFFALLKFDVSNIEGSVPVLLDGMKFAFSTSIYGIIGSIIVKYVNFYMELKNEENGEDIDDVIGVFNLMLNDMRILNETLINNQKQTDETFDNLSKIFSDNQQELKNELISLSDILSKKQDILIDEFHKFGEKMAKNNTDALMDALNDVIRDFNNKITEQFGDNFKQLNQSVEKMLIWQENYKYTIEKTIEQLNINVDSIKNIDSSLVNINTSLISIDDKSRDLINVANSTDKILYEVSNSQEKLTYILTSLVDISEKAKESIPKLDLYIEKTNNSIIESIDNNIEKATEFMNKLSEDISKVSSESINSVKDTSEQITNNVSENLIENSNKLKLNIESYVEELENLTKELNIVLPGVINEIKENYNLMNNIISEFSKDSSNLIKFTEEQIKAQCETLIKSNEDIREVLKVQIENISESASEEMVKVTEKMESLFLNRVEEVNKLLEHELKESLNSLGTQLATLSEKFVEDYLPLTQKLKEVVSIAEGV